MKMPTKIRQCFCRRFPFGAILLLMAISVVYLATHAGNLSVHSAVIAKTHHQTADTTDDSAITVCITEFNIDIPIRELYAGQAAFRVTNLAPIEHAFEIERAEEPREKYSINSLSPGETQTLVVKLRPGKYLVYAPVQGIMDRGMPVELTVYPNDYLTNS